MRKITEEEVEKKLRNFLLNRVLPLMTDESEEGYPLKADLIGNKHGSIFNEINYGAFLDQWLGTAGTESSKCKCTKEIINNGGLSLLQLLIFIVKHNLDFCDNAGHYCDGGCYLYIEQDAELDVGTSINISFAMHSMLLGDELSLAVKSGFDHLKAKYCGKNYMPSNTNFNYEYWKIQAELFFKGLPYISNKGCSNKKSGITWNKECKDCIYFKTKNEYSCCGFDYYKEYRKVGFFLILPDDGKTYACKHFITQ